MYEYKSVKLGLKKQSGIKGIIFSELEDYNETIHEHAKEGWRLVQILPVKYGNSGYPMEFEIIFEQKVDNY